RVELELSRLLVVAQLHHGGGRLAEPDRDGAPGLEGGALHDERLPCASGFERARAGAVGADLVPVALPRERFHALALGPPDHAVARPGRAGGVPQRLARGAVGIRTRRERLAGAEERRERRCRTLRGDPQRQRELGGEQLGEDGRCRVELADELDRAEELVARTRGNEPPVAARLRADGDARAGDLGGERCVAGRDRARDEHSLALVEYADDRELDPELLDRDLRDELERLRRRCACREPLAEPCQAFERQPLGFDHHLQRKYRLESTCGQAGAASRGRRPCTAVARSGRDRARLPARARRRARHARDDAARNSSARYWLVMAFLLFLTVVIGLTAWHQVQTTFGI